METEKWECDYEKEKPLPLFFVLWKKDIKTFEKSKSGQAEARRDVYVAERRPNMRRLRRLVKHLRKKIMLCKM